MSKFINSFSILLTIFIPEDKSKCSLIVQWVCSKISVILIADEVTTEKKFVIDVDEILFSIHQQDFYQLKSKIASISGTLFERKEGSEEWTKNITLGLNVQSDENSSDNANRFLDLTITKAQTVNVHSRWNIGHKRNRLYNNDITEINVILQPLDIIANLDELVEFMPIFVGLRGCREPQEEQTVQPKAGSDLPLVHVVCNGFRIFLPCLSEDDSAPDVWIMKINKLHVTPTAVNNLIRNQILRPDIHSKACALGILDLAGSKIEDRQYQVTVQGVSLSSSNWGGIAALINEKTVIESYDNPAFEWNNLEFGPKSPNFKLNTIFKDSTFSFIYAPCIKFKQTLIAGTAMEFNCVNDLNIEMTLKEVALIISVGERIGKISKALLPAVKVERKTSKETKEAKQTEATESLPVFEKRKTFEKKSLDDSGVESISQSNRFKDRKLWRKKTSTVVCGWDDSTHVPFEFTFTSSKFKLNCSSGDNEILAIFDTPNVFITQDKYEKCFNLSLHDLLIMYGTERIFSTRDGVADSSGIKPSLVRVKLTEKSVKNTDLSIHFKRPILVEFSHEKLVKIFQLIETLNENSILKTAHETRELQVNNKSRKFDAMKSHLHGLRTVNVSTSQIVVNVKAQEYSLKLAMSEVKGKIKAFDRPEKIEVNCDITNLLLLNRGKMALHPWSIQSKLKITQEYWKKDPMVHINVNSSFLRFDFGWDLLKDVKVCAKMFSDVLEQRNGNRGLSEKVSQKIPSNLIPLQVNSFTNNIHSTIEHFQDDLRSGAFQFIETSSTRDLPLPYQIQIIDNEEGIICWRYPLPRALHKIKIFPVPFQTANQVSVVCKIEFYSHLKSKFEEFCDFTLAENETKLLDLKQNRPSAEVWRIKIPRVFIKRDSDDEDEGGDYEFQMHPKVLVACLRIDSYYVSSAIPNVGMYLEFSHIELNVMNKITSAARKPAIVENYQLVEDRGKEHEAAKAVIKSLKIFGQFFDEGYEIFEIDATLAAEVIDYGCGNLLPIIDDFRFKTLLDFHHSDVNVNIITDNIQTKYSPAIGHSLLVTKNTWEHHLSGSDAMVLHTKFIICNNTASPVGISQFQTNEMICLMPQAFVLYHFRTDKLEQKLQLCVCLKGLWSVKTEAIQIQNEGVEYVKLDEHQYFVVTVKSVTNFQRKVTIEG